MHAPPPSHGLQQAPRWALRPLPDAPCAAGNASLRAAWRQRRPRHASAQTSATTAAAAGRAPGGLAQAFEDRIVVVGGGPAGLAAGVALQAVGLPAVVLERGPELSTGGTALGLWTNAWRALEALGVADELRAQHPQVDRCGCAGVRPGVSWGP